MAQEKQRSYRLISFLSVCALVITAVVLLLATVRYDVRVSEDEIRTRIESKLPIDQKGLTVSNVQVRLVDGHAVIDASGSVKKLSQEYSFQIHAAGVPVYDSWKGQFFFKPNDIELVSFENSKGEGKLTSALKGLADKYLTDNGSVKLNTIGTEIASKAEGWIKETAERAVTFGLERMPVYRLKSDFKGIAVRSVLDSVHIEGQDLVATLTLYRLTIWVGIMFVVLLFFVVMIGAAIVAPEAVMAIGVLGALGS